MFLTSQRKPKLFYTPWHKSSDVPSVQFHWSPYNDICSPIVSVPFVLGFALLTTMTWLYHVLGPRVMVRAVSASRYPIFGTCCHLISRTVMLVANSSSRALRLGSLCKPTHKRRLWELCLSGALQILDLIEWLITFDPVNIRFAFNLSKSPRDQLGSNPWDQSVREKEG